MSHINKNYINYIFSGRRNNLVDKNPPLRDLMKISEVVYEHKQFPQINEDNEDNEASQTCTQTFYKSLKENQVSFSNILPNNKNNDNDFKEMVFSPELEAFLNLTETN